MFRRCWYLFTCQQSTSIPCALPIAIFWLNRNRQRQQSESSYSLPVCRNPICVVYTPNIFQSSCRWQPKQTNIPIASIAHGMLVYLSTLPHLQSQHFSGICLVGNIWSIVHDIIQVKNPNSIKVDYFPTLKNSLKFRQGEENVF